MTRKGMTRRQLAAANGISHGAINNAFSNCSKSRRARLAIEWTLGGSFWTSSEVFAQRVLASRLVGGRDPAAVHIYELRRVAGELGIIGRAAVPRKADLIALLAKHASESAGDRRDETATSSGQRRPGAEQGPGSPAAENTAERLGDEP